MNYSNQVQIHNRKKTDDRMFCSSSNKYKMKKNINWDMDWDAYLKKNCTKSLPQKKIKQPKEWWEDNNNEEEMRKIKKEKLQQRIKDKKEELAMMNQLRELEMNKPKNFAKKNAKIKNPSCCIIM